MNYVKKLTALILMLVLTVSLVSCGKNDRNETAKSLSIEEPVTITVWFSDKSYTDYLRLAAEEFSLANNLVSIKLEYKEVDDILQTVYDETVRNNNAPDIYLMSSEDCEKAYLMGLMLENNKFPEVYSEDNYGSACLRECSFDGKLYGYPIDFNAAFMIYNKDYMSEVSSFNEINEMTENHVVDESNKNVSMVFNMDASSMFPNYAFAGSYITFSEETDTGEVSIGINETAVKAALKKYAELKEIHGIKRNFTTMETCIEQFNSGRLMCTIIDAKHLNQIDATKVRYGICAIPSLDDNLVSKTLSVTTMAVVNPYTSNIEVSQAVAKAFSYDYVDTLETYAGRCAARANIEELINKEAYDNIHAIYSESTNKARYIGLGEFYIRYEILLHDVWDGKDIDESYAAFKESLKGFNVK
ncbi:MAG: hypothetical protein ACI4E1_06190 [Lachnospira sp.]